MADSHLILSASVGRVQVVNQLEDYVLENRIVFAAEKVAVASEMGRFEGTEHGATAVVIDSVPFSPRSVAAPMMEAAVVIRKPNAMQQITLFEYVAMVSASHAWSSQATEVSAGLFVLYLLLFSFRDAYLRVKNLQVNVELSLVAALIPLVQPLLSTKEVCF